MSETILYDKQGEILQRMSYRENILDGELVIYHHKNIHSITSYVEGKKQGMQTIFHSNNQLSCERLYENDLLEGQCCWYSENNILIKVAYYHQNKLHGKTILFNHEGKIIEKSTYFMGKLSGYLLRFNQENKPSQKIRYVNNIPQYCYLLQTKQQE